MLGVKIIREPIVAVFGLVLDVDPAQRAADADALDEALRLQAWDPARSARPTFFFVYWLFQNYNVL